MWERIIMFLPEIVPTAIIGIVAFAATLWVDCNTDWEGLPGSRYERKRRKMLSVGLPSYLIISPMLEELIHRLPLILFFPTLSVYAWGAIVLSTSVFAAVHHGQHWADVCI